MVTTLISEIRDVNKLKSEEKRELLKNSKKNRKLDKIEIEEKRQLLKVSTENKENVTEE